MPSTLYAATDIGVFRSTDSGSSFVLAGLANIRVLLLVIDPVRSNVLYAATSNNDWAGPPAFLGLYKSTDSGATWSAINQGLDEIGAAHALVNALLLDPDHANILYLATSSYGVFRSSDGGATWAAFNDGLTLLDVRSLALVRSTVKARRGSRPGASILYAGTPGGIFKMPYKRGVLAALIGCAWNKRPRPEPGLHARDLVASVIEEFQWTSKLSRHNVSISTW